MSTCGPVKEPSIDREGGSRTSVTHKALGYVAATLAEAALVRREIVLFQDELRRPLV